MVPASVREQYFSSCLDGSDFGFYVRRNNASDKWVLFLEGGGLCVEPIDCWQRMKGHLGSSKNFSKQLSYSSDGGQDILDNDASANPYFFDYNHVFLPYCSGDTWTGTHKQKNFEGLTFAGHFNIQAAIAVLNQAYSFRTSTHVLLMGASAGGIGTFNNADFVKAVVPASAVFKAAPVAGLYFPAGVVEFVEFALHIEHPINDAASLYLTDWFHSALDRSCLSYYAEHNLTHLTHRCWDGHWNYPHIQSSLFVVENRFDENQIHEILLCPKKDTNETQAFIEDFGTRMAGGFLSTVLSPLGKAKGDGIFAPSCLVHTQNICMQGGPPITSPGGKDAYFRTVLHQWFSAPSTANSTSFQLVDHCNAAKHTLSPCNPHCKC